MKSGGKNLHQKTTGFGNRFYVGIAAVVLMICISSFIWETRTRITSKETVNELGEFYLEEIAERNVNSIVAELERRTKQMEYALTELNDSYLKDEVSIRKYISMVQSINGLDMFALVDEEGMVYTADSTFSGISRFGFLSEQIEETGYYTVKSYGTQAMVIISVPTHKSFSEGIRIKACFSGLNVESVISTNQLQSVENQSYCRIFTKEGENLIRLNEDYPDGRNLFDILNESATFDKGYSLEKIKQDWKNDSEGYTVYSTKTAGSTYVYYYPVPGTNWVITSLMRESNINEVINTSTKKMVFASLNQVMVVAVAMIILLAMILQVTKKMHETQETLNILEIISALGRDYLNVFIVDTKEETTQILKMEGYVTEGFNKHEKKIYPYFEMCKRYVMERVYKEDIEKLLDAMKIETLKKELMDKDEYSRSYRVLENGEIHYYQFKYIRMEGTDNLIAGFQNIDALVWAEKERIENERKMTEQFIISHTDELTSLMNRRAYEEDLKSYFSKAMENTLVYVSIDANGLKGVNDTLGHMAGDELIVGAADCLKSSLGAYGKVYRIGGDEFAAIIFANSKQLNSIKSELEKRMTNWRGTMVKKLSLSVGYIAKSEYPDWTIIELAKEADNRMYKAKEEYYSGKAINKRGQHEAYLAICNSYIKILKVNLNSDTYSIVRMDEREKVGERGFTDKLSLWLRQFAISGQVHEEDLKEYLEKTSLEYLRNYFKNNASCFSIFYRRLHGKEYRRTKMEIYRYEIPDTINPNYYLYVKDIE